NGMLLWLLAFPIETRNGCLKPPRRLQSAVPGNESPPTQRWFWLLAYLLAAIISVGFYFVGYKHPSDTPSFAVGPTQLPQLLHYFEIWLGNLFISPAPALLGIVTLTIFVLLAVMAVRLNRIRDLPWVCYPWLVLGSYVLISGLVTAS